MKQLELYIPRQHIAASYELRVALHELIGAVGGVTVYDSVGSWYDGTGVEYRDTIAVHRFIVPKGTPVDPSRVVEVLKGLGEHKVLITCIKDVGVALL